MLDALQELTRLAVQSETGERSRLMLDVAGHRAERRADVVEIAQTAIAQVKTTGEQTALDDDVGLRAQDRPRRGAGRRSVLRVRRRRAASGTSSSSRREPAHDARVSRETARMTAQSAPTTGAAPGRPVPRPSRHRPGGSRTAAAAASRRRAVFGDRLALAERFAAILADTGVSHGLIGPREAPLLWDRHVLNCAVVHAAFPPDASGRRHRVRRRTARAPLAIARPDLHLHLVEPLLRRTVLALDDHRGARPDNCRCTAVGPRSSTGCCRFRHVTARAVARTDKLARSTFPLLEDGGSLVALKGGLGGRAGGEEKTAAHARHGAASGSERYGAELLPVPTTDPAGDHRCPTGAKVPRPPRAARPKAERAGPQRSLSRRRERSRLAADRTGREWSAGRPVGAGSASRVVTAARRRVG